MDKIGKVKLDYSVYGGADLYCDGAVEDELLRIAEDCSSVEFKGIIEEKADWPIFYHLSPIRENIVRWLPITKNDKVLEVGSGCGAVSGALCEMAGEVVSCDLSKKRSLINAYRHNDCDNLTIHVGNFTDVEKNLDSDFDYICLIGVLEYGQSYIASDTPYEDFLLLLKKHLKKNGRIVIAIENRMGLKYLSGCKEDHLGKWFKGIEGYEKEDGVKTFSKHGLIKLFDNAGIKDYHFYYPYPDYKFMNTVFSDKRLPKSGELVDNSRNFDRDRMNLFDEALAFDTMIEDGTFDEYSNSYMVVLGPDTNVDYARFSNDRADEYAIFTSILDMGGEKVVKKQALFEVGDKHIEALKNYYDLLSKRYEGSKLSVNKCKLSVEGGRPAAYFEYIDGEVLSERFNEFTAKTDSEGFKELFDEYVKRIGFNEDFKATNRDMIFGNIIVKDDVWTLIDYEWTVEKSIPTRELAFRTIYCYTLEHKNANKLNLDLILDGLNISEELADDIRYDESRFQKQITGNHLALSELRDKIGYKIYEPVKLLNNYMDHKQAYRFQVYKPVPGMPGFSEENSFFIDDAYVDDSHISIDLTFNADVNMVRLDPLMESCMVTVTSCTYNNEVFPVEDKKALRVNGKRVDGNSFVFATNDPNMEFSFDRLPKSSENTFHAEMEIFIMPQEAAGKISENIKRIF